jgi:branched-subunit amino acid permease
MKYVVSFLSLCVLYTYGCYLFYQLGYETGSKYNNKVLQTSYPVVIDDTLQVYIYELEELLQKEKEYNEWTNQHYINSLETSNKQLLQDLYSCKELN